MYAIRSYYDIAHAGGNTRRGGHDRLHTGTARHRDAPGGNFHRNTRVNGNLPRDALSATRGQDVADDHFVQPVGRNASQRA